MGEYLSRGIMTPWLHLGTRYDGMAVTQSSRVHHHPMQLWNILVVEK